MSSDQMLMMKVIKNSNLKSLFAAILFSNPPLN